MSSIGTSHAELDTRVADGRGTPDESVGLDTMTFSSSSKHWRSLARRVLVDVGLLRPLLSLKWFARKCLRSARRSIARLRSRRRAGGEHVVVATDDGVLVSFVVDDVTSVACRSSNLTIMTELLDDAGIEFVRHPFGDRPRESVGIRATDAPALAHAVSADRSPRYLYLRRGAKAPVLAARGADSKAHPTAGETTVFFRPVSDRYGNGLIGDEYGTELVTYSDDDFARLVRRASQRPPEPDPLTSPFPIDVVYTWVDGTDTTWNERMSAALRGSDHPPAGAAPERFASLDLLRWSLRSLHQNVPWVRNIYLVTDAQTPSWFVPNRGLSIVDHRQIFTDESVLPVFNSHAIEANLHHIEGLSEHFVYLNDDVFFGRLTFWTELFTPDGRTLFAESLAEVPEHPHAHSKLVDHAGRNARHLLLDRFESVPTTKIKHTPHPQRRSVHERMNLEFPGLYDRVSRSRFRSRDDVSVAAFLHHRYGEQTGTALVGDMTYDYVDLTRRDLEPVLHELRRRRGFWCLNDGAIPATRRPRVDRVVSAFLDEMFPFPAPWELGTANVAEPGTNRR